MASLTPPILLLAQMPVVGPTLRTPALGQWDGLARRHGQQIEVLGTLSGVIMPPATVPQGEHVAIIEAIKNTTGLVDLTTDCKGVLKTLGSASPCKKLTPEWGDVCFMRDRVKAQWIRAHKEEEDFNKEFPQQELRRQLNIAADHLAGHRAKEALNPHAARRVQEVDRVATEANDYLAFRAEEQLQSKDNEFVPRSVRDTLSQFDKSQQRPHAKALYANKRDRLKQMLAESSMGHTWQFTRGETATNLQLKCTVCELWVQQTYSQEVFQRVDSHPCKNFPNQGPRYWPSLHPSHSWFSTGKTWECSGCGVGFGPAVVKAPAKATKVCANTLGVKKLCFAKSSSPRTEACPVLAGTSTTGTEVTGQAKAIVPKTPKSAFDLLQQGSPPKPKSSSSAMTEGSHGHVTRPTTSKEPPKPKPPTKGPRAKPKSKPDPKQTLLAGPASSDGAQARGPAS